MGEVVREKPETMPGAADLEARQGNLLKKYLLAGCRGDRRVGEPDPEVHGKYRLVGNWAGDLAGKRLFLFLHGYNVKRFRALQLTTEFFQRFQPSLQSAGLKLDECVFASFTWPGDVGLLSFNLAQEFAQVSGVALFHFLAEVASTASSTTLISHSLGAHVMLRAGAILGERFASGKSQQEIANAVMLAPAVEDDVFRRPTLEEEYHFPEAAFSIGRLDIVCSRSDEAMHAFNINEKDRPLGLSGPESMEPLASLSRRVEEVGTALGHLRAFRFEQHDFSPRSSTIFDSRLFVHNHGDYWRTPQQTDYYVHLLQRPPL